MGIVLGHPGYWQKVNVSSTTNALKYKESSLAAGVLVNGYAEDQVSGSRSAAFFRLTNDYDGDYFSFIVRKTVADTVMLQSCYDAGLALFREILVFNYTTRRYEIRNGIMDIYFNNVGTFVIGNSFTTGTSPLNIKNLPTSAVGLSTGDVWYDNATGSLYIVS